MPFRHVAMFRWADHVDADHVDRVRDAYDALTDQVPGLRHLAHGPDVGVSEGTFDYLVVADFESVVEWRSFRDHPAHVLLTEELIVRHTVDRVTGQFHVTDGRGVHAVSAVDGASRLAEPVVGDGDAGPVDIEESDEELMARARRAAMAEMQSLLAEPDEPGSPG